MSGYLLMEKETLVSEANKQTPVLMCHGELDPVVSIYLIISIIQSILDY